jgi:NADH:ubiquinone oxidoreductase subunit 3 (subunit A)
MGEVQFPAYFYNPLLVGVAGLMWLYCLASLLVPKVRAQGRYSSLFSASNSPMGRGNARASTMRSLMVFAVLSIDLVANFHISSPGSTIVEFGFAVVACLSFVLVLTLIYLNWPRFLAPKSMRRQPGAFQEWFASARRPKARVR